MITVSAQWICTHCGHFSTQRFPDDICPVCKLTDWQCRRCGYTLTATAQPCDCIQCGAINRFTNISCYIPDWPMMDEVEALLAG